MPDRSEWFPVSKSQSPFYAGIDLGGTNIKTGLVDDLGRTLAYHREPTLVAQGPEDGAQRMGQSVLRVAELAGINVNQIARVGLGTPGTMDIPAGMLREPPNLPGWRQFPVRDRVSAHCGLDVTYANDGGAAAYGEFWIGSGRELSSMVLWTLGTGIGCGIIVDDMSIDGAHSHGAECGHIIVDDSDDERLCPCGQRGHLEAYASATSLMATAREQFKKGAGGSLAEAVAAGEILTPILISKHAESGDQLSANLILEAARWLGIGTVTLLHTIDPEGVVIGGAMTFGGESAPIGRMFIERVRQEVRARAFPIPAERTTIRYASLGGDAGYAGAAGLARLEHRRRSGITFA